MSKLLTTAEAAAYLTARGVLVRGNPPKAQTVKVWCHKGQLPARYIGGPERGIYLIEQADLETFEPPKLGRRKAPDRTND